MQDFEEQALSQRLGKGWTNPLGSVARHYILSGDSLCGLWMNVFGPLSQDRDDAPENCVKCRGQLGRLRMAMQLEKYAALVRQTVRVIQTESNRPEECGDE
jgi:hypothetical protein